MSLRPLPIVVPPPAPPAAGGRAEGLGGLLGPDSSPFPLVSVRVRAMVLGAFSRTVVEQVFLNPHQAPIEAVHIFPLPPGGAVVEMELHAGDVVVRAECRAREEARAAFDAARSAGHRAALLDSERPDVHTLRVTNIPPGAQVRVRFVLVEVLDAVDGRYCWRFPTTIAPRYMPGAATGQSGSGVEADTDQVPDASRISPPLRLAGGTRLDLEVELLGPIAGVASSLHAVSVQLSADEELGERLRVAPSAQATLNRDFVLLYTTADAEHLRTRAYRDAGHTLLVLEPPSRAMAVSLPRDAVFILDVSGSMSGAKLSAAIRALKSALHGLSLGDRFRLIVFNTAWQAHSPQFLDYDGASLASADQWIAGLRASGGTVMVPPLREALDGPTPAGRVRTVLFITDGQAGDEDQVLATVAGRRGATRVFTLGIDTAVNASLLQRLARVGGGTAELCTPQDDIEGVVARLEARFGSPLLTGVTVTGVGGPLVAANPETGTLFSGRPLTCVFEGAPATLELSGVGPAGAYFETVTPMVVEAPLGAIWARERIRWIEDRLAVRPFEEEAIRAEVLRIALPHNLVSRFTSLIAVDSSSKVVGAPIEVVQPVEQPESWAALAAPGAIQIASPAPKMAAPSRRSGPVIDRMAMAGSAKSRRAPEEPAVSPPGLVDRALSSLGRVFGSGSADAASRPPVPPPPASLEAPPPAPMSRPAPLAAPAGASAGRADAPKAPKRMQEVASAPAGSDTGGALARSQSADGSFDGDVSRTLAALLVLIKLGSTRRSGTRLRVVVKAAAWLVAHRDDPRVAAALALLERVEAGEAPILEPEWVDIAPGSPEGDLLRAMLRA